MDMIGKKTLAHYFDELAATHGKKTAVVCEDANGKISSLSYKELNTRINQTANLLKSLNVKRGDLVAIHLLNSIEYVISFMAIAKLGAIVVPINANYIYADTLFIVKKTNPVLAITSDNFVQIYKDIDAKEFKFNCGILLVGQALSDELEKFSTKFKTNSFSNLNPAQIIFTSGTSSFPKGVVITHYNMIFAGFYTAWQVRLNSNDIYLTAMPLWHIDAQCTVMMPTFSSGACLVLLEKFSARKFWDQIISHKATVTECIPKMIHTMMLQDVKPNEKKHHLREMLFYLNISNKDLKAFLKRFGIKSVLSSYGMSETVVGLIGDRPNEKRKFPSIGRVGFCYEAKVVDKNGHELGANQKGEICIRGERGKSIFDGYFENDEATNKVLSSDGWLKTGDIGYFDKQGYFYFIDRDVNLIKVKGENVSSVEVETYINSHEKVLEVAVIGIPDDLDNELIKACVVVKDGVTLCENEIIEFCRSGLAKFKVPTLVEFYTNLPKTCTNKVKKNVLRSEHLNKSSNQKQL